MNYRCAKFGDVAEICTVKPEDDLILISSDGIVIRIAVDSVSTFNRPAKGVRVMKVKDGEKLITAAVTDKVEEKTEDEPTENNDESGNNDNATDNVVENAEVVAESGVEKAIDELIDAADKPMDEE